MNLNYFCFKKFDDKYLLTNELGKYIFVNEDDFNALVNEEYHLLDEVMLDELKEKFFIFDDNLDVFIEKTAIPYRDMKEYLFSATSLHIFVMTNACNMCCVYCQAQDSAQKYKDVMSIDVAEKAVEIALQTPVNSITFEFQGGEPLTNFETIKHIVEYTEERKNDKAITYTIVTNTLLLNDEILSFFKKYNFAVSTSLDGDKELHNINRPRIGGQGTYDDVRKGIGLLQSHDIKTGAIQTTTRQSLKKAKGIVEAYKNNNLHYIFLRPLTPLGYAKEHWDEIGYTPKEFLEFYKEALKEIIKCNLEGYPLPEGHAAIFLRKILNGYSDNYMELRSPCGAGVGQLAYYYDGNIYTCDEGRMMAEMGMPDFKVGDVDCRYEDLMDSDVCKVTCQASVLEGLPQCCDCVYHSYCGTCPVLNFAIEDNIYSREANGYRCELYKGMLDILFEYIKNDEDALEIFKKWL